MARTIDEDILHALTIDGAHSQTQLWKRFKPRYSTGEIRNALRRLKSAGKARCNVDRPYWNWHAIKHHATAEE